jgi:hypothetical protein
VRREGYRLAHSVGQQKEVAPITYDGFMGQPAPIDAAIARLEDNTLLNSDYSTLQISAFDKQYSPASGELMFLHGYRAAWGHKFTEDTLGATSMPLTVDVLDLPCRPDLDARKHFSVRYPIAAYLPGDDAGMLPAPAGCSGSLLWDTKYVASGRDGWTPLKARVCGLVFGQDNGFLFALKVEILRDFLLETLRHEAAYYRWRDGKTPELENWLWAEKHLASIDSYIRGCVK